MRAEVGGEARLPRKSSLASLPTASKRFLPRMRAEVNREVRRLVELPLTSLPIAMRVVNERVLVSVRCPFFHVSTHFGAPWTVAGNLGLRQLFLEMHSVQFELHRAQLLNVLENAGAAVEFFQRAPTFFQVFLDEVHCAILLHVRPHVFR